MSLATFLIVAGLALEGLAIVQSLIRLAEDRRAVAVPRDAITGTATIREKADVFAALGVVRNSDEPLEEKVDRLESSVESLSQAIADARADRSTIRAAIESTLSEAKSYGDGKLAEVRSNELVQRRVTVRVDGYTLITFAIGAILQGVGTLLSL